MPGYPARVTRRRIPDEVLDAAHARALAREARDWAEADRLRGEIEAAGWKVADRGTDFALTPAAPPDVEDGPLTRYGSSASVPSRLDEAPVGLASVVIVATDWPDDVARARAALGVHAPAGTSLVIVADGPSDSQAQALDRLDPVEPRSAIIPTEIVWTSDRLGHGAALNIGIRRATGPIVIVMDASVEPERDVVSPLVAVLADPSVGVAGPWGIVSDDLRTFSDGSAGDVDAIEGYLMAFRRADYVERGPLDERFRFYRNLDIWWSLVLRDEGAGLPPRRAVMVDQLAISRHEHRGFVSLSDDERDRQSKRNFYRIIDRFGARRDLLVGG